MRINNNIMALNTHRQLGINNTNTQKSLEKLSSGFRINRAGDDAAGLAISEKMRGQIRGLNMASKNAQDGISLIQTAEGGLNETHDILQRMRELAVQSANDTNVEVDRGEIQKEVDQLASEITRIANTTEFNTQKLLNGGVTDTKFHIGANEKQNVQLDINAMDAFTLGVARDSKTVEGTVAGNIAEVTFADDLGDKVVDGAEITFKFEKGKVTVSDGAEGSQDVTITDDTATSLTITDGNFKGITINLGEKTLADLTDGNDKVTVAVTEEKAQAAVIKDGKVETEAVAPKGINVSTQDAADSAITTINKAIETVSSERSKLGAMQNRLEHTIKNLDTSAENLQAAESRIRDVDMAKEMMEFTKQNILQQAATAMLAQANMAPQSVLKLLG